MLVVACNTASALALPAIRRAVEVEVVGVIEPGARAAISVGSDHRIGVIATEATVQSHAYRTAISTLDQHAEVIERACPLFVSLAEEGWSDTTVARDVAIQYLKDLDRTRISALVLGCTHYPILRSVIQDIVGHDVMLIDSGEATAAEVRTFLKQSGLAHSDTSGLYQERRLCDDLDHFYVTDAATRFAKVAERFLGVAPTILEAVEVWGHDELRTH
jgi:glutamate racemase